MLPAQEENAIAARAGVASCGTISVNFYCVQKEVNKIFVKMIKQLVSDMIVLGIGNVSS